MWLPMNPAPPVTRIFMLLPAAGWRATAPSAAADQHTARRPVPRGGAKAASCEPRVSCHIFATAFPYPGPLPP